MPVRLDPLGRIGRFLEAGGPVLWAILLTSLLLWMLALERYGYLFGPFRARCRREAAAWRRRADRRSWRARQIRNALISEAAASLRHSLPLIRTLTALLPLMGLLGTVTGMIGTFEVMTRSGIGDLRGMASGISEALVTTMAGLVTALSGVFLGADLRRRTAGAIRLLADLLPEETGE